MKVVKTYKFKLKPSKSQQRTFEQWLNTCRYLYNNALEHRITAYQSNKTSITKYGQYNELPCIKNTEGLEWITAVHSDVLQETLDRVDRSFKNFFRGAGFPKFQGKKFYTSFTFKRSFKINSNTIKLPKIGEVKYYNSRQVLGTPKYATIKKQIDGWYICISAETEIQSVTIDDSQAIGIDKGIAVFASLSDGNIIESPLFLEPNLRKLRILQRKLTRKVKGSNNYFRVKKQIAKLHQKIARQRQDFLHKHSTILANNYSSCYVEDLKISNMVKLNSTLSRRMLDSGFYDFRQKLDYKFKERSKHFVAVAPHYTSQMCSGCGETDKKHRISQSEYVCTSCGHTENADLNAAKNIKVKGINLRSKREALACA